MSRISTNIFKILLPVFAIAILALVNYWTRDYAEYFAKQHGRLTEANVDPFRADTTYEKSWLHLKNDEGFHVTCGMMVPRPPTKTGGGPEEQRSPRRYPAIILLGGKATGRYAIDYAMDIEDIIIVSPDYPYEPRTSYTILQFLGDVPEIRQALMDMVPSVMLVTEYLWQREDVDTSRIILLGYSFGAPFVPVLIAHDRRPAVAAMVFGGGDMRSLIRHNVARYEGAMTSWFAGELSAILLRPLEPMRYIEQVSPTPLVMINGSEDEQIPRENVELLYTAAHEPKNIIWLESRHVNPRNVELTRTIIKTLKGELMRLKVLVPPP
jgi:dienelactone hydrolase